MVVVVVAMMMIKGAIRYRALPPALVLALVLVLALAHCRCQRRKKRILRATPEVGDRPTPARWAIRAAGLASMSKVSNLRIDCDIAVVLVLIPVLVRTRVPDE
jgi:Mg2+/citrate symporter